MLVSLDPTFGHEQRGLRPCVVVSDPAANTDQHFPILAVVPVTGTEGRGVLYPRLEPGPSGLTKPSFALTDNLRSIDKRRIQTIWGSVTEAELAAIDEGILRFLGLVAQPE